MLEQIEQRQREFSPAEQKVAAWVVANPRQAVNATLASVAEAAGASEPTVIRFCRRLGLRGFREFGIRLAERLSRPTGVIHTRVGASDSIADASYKVLDASIQTLVDLRATLGTLPLEQAAAALAGSEQIVFMGLGASGNVARDACHKFFRLGIACSLFADSPSILQFAAIASSKCTIVFISNTGRWPELSAAAQLARQCGATTLALTQADSPLAAAADVLLPCESDEDPGAFTPMSSRLAHLALLDALHVAVALQLGADAQQKLVRVKAAVRRG